MTNSWGLLGHDWAVELLQGQIRVGAHRHAYLITGPQGIGRRTLALRLFQALNADSPPAIEDTQSSRQIARMQYPDLSLIEVQEDARDIKIEQVRELGRSLMLAPYTARHRMALLRDFENASVSAQNALLKTLEEPPGLAVLVLTASSSEALLPTIVSRCEVIRLRPLSYDLVAEGLTALWQVPAEQAVLLAHLSGGRPGYALALYNDPEALAQRGLWLDEHAELLSANKVARFNYAQQITKDKAVLQEALQVWLSFWRDVLMRAGGSAAPLTNPDRAAQVEQVAGRLDLSAAREATAALERTLELLKGNTNPRLAVEVLLLDIPNI